MSGTLVICNAAVLSEMTLQVAPFHDGILLDVKRVFAPHARRSSDRNLTIDSDDGVERGLPTMGSSSPCPHGTQPFSARSRHSTLLLHWGRLPRCSAAVIRQARRDGTLGASAPDGIDPILPASSSDPSFTSPSPPARSALRHSDRSPIPCTTRRRGGRPGGRRSA
ncbi:MAG: hypothetical protein QOC81_4528 [Thermoanaerobaculia bacterium]|nr:hypothetical protein [Thermoanaerobaculia bacterium]